MPERIFSLARRLRVDTMEIVDACQVLGIRTDRKLTTSLTAMKDSEVALIEEFFAKKSAEEAEAENTESVAPELQSEPANESVGLETSAQNVEEDEEDEDNGAETSVEAQNNDEESDEPETPNERVVEQPRVTPVDKEVEKPRASKRARAKTTEPDEPLRDCEILIGVCGGIAAYKAVELTSLLVKAGAKPTVVMTEAATRLVAPRTFEAISNRPVATSMWSDNMAHPHIELARQAKIFCVAPATANVMAKAACGLADDLMTSTILAFDGALIFAPAMNSVMWNKPATQRNRATLEADGATIVGPESGRLSCGEEGVGRMVEPNEILRAIEQAARELAKIA